MFRLEFQSMAAAEEGGSGSDYVNDSVYEPAIFEGKVGRFGRVQRVVARPVDLERLAPWRSRILSANDNQPGSGGNFREAELMSPHSPCLQGVTTDENNTHAAIFLDAQVLRELVLGGTDHVREDDDDEEDGSDETASSRCESVRSDSSLLSDFSSASEGSVAELNALQRGSKPWEEPLLALHQQGEVAHRARREGAEEAARIAAQSHLEATRRQRELQDLANCVDYSPNRFKKNNKLQKALSKTGVAAVCRFFRNPFGLFKSHKIHNRHNSREAMDAPHLPRKALSELYPASADAALAQMNSIATRRARSAFQFATVSSTQRDVQPWTMEEYMARNARLQEWSRSLKRDEEFGGIEGNNLMHQICGNDAHHAHDSDSD